MEKIGQNGDGKSAEATLDERRRNEEEEDNKLYTYTQYLLLRSSLCRQPYRRLP